MKKEISRSDQYFHSISDILTGISNKFSGTEPYQRIQVEDFLREIVHSFLIPCDINTLPLDTFDFRYLPLDDEDMEILIDSYFGVNNDSVNYYLAEMICGELTSGYVDQDGVPLHRAFQLVNCDGDYISESFSLIYTQKLAKIMNVGEIVIATTPVILL